MIKALIIGFFLLLSLPSVAKNQADSILSYIQNKKDHAVDTGVVDFLNQYSQSHDIDQLAQFSENITSLYRMREEYFNEYSARQRTVVLLKNARKFDNAIALTLMNIDLVNGHLPELTSVQAYANLGVIFYEYEMLEESDSAFYLGESQISDLTSNAHAVLIYNGKGNLLNLQGRHKEAIEQLRIAFNLCDKSNYNLIAGITTNIALNFQIIGKLDSSILYLQKAENAYEKADNERGYAISLYTKANTLFELGKYSEALEHHQKAFELFNKLKVPPGEVAVLNELGNVLKKLGDTEGASKTYRKALALSQEIQHTRFECVILSSIGKLQYQSQNIDSAIASFHSALEIAVSKGYEGQGYSIQSNLALCYLREGKDDLAQELLTEVLEQARDDGDPAEIINALNASAKLSSKIDPTSSMRMLNSALSLSKKHQLLNLQVESMEQLSVLHANNGAFDSAYTYLKQIKEYRETLNERELIEETAYLSNKISFLKTQNEVIAQKQTINDLQLEQEKLNTLITLIVSISLIVLIVLAWLYHWNRAKQKLNQKKLSDKLIFNSLEQERRRFAKDLHDGIGQKLLILKSERIKTDSLDEGSVIDETIEEMRRISHNLFPAALERLGLEKAVEEMLLEIESLHGLITHLEVESNFGVLPIETQTMIYRMIQEGTNNCIKHAKAKSIRVDMRMEGNNVELRIQDNGIGIQNTKESSGIGIQSIRTRIESLGGYLKINSTSDSGTTLTLAFVHGSGKENFSS